MEKLEEEIQKVKIELTHRGYHDGWTLNYLNENLKNWKENYFKVKIILLKWNCR